MADILCAGHICLDIIPTLNGPFDFDPGKLIEVGAATVSTGGCVPNTGLALHRLGASVELCGRLGDDAFGRLVLDVLHRERLPQPMKLTGGAETSYTVVLNPPGQDRMFLHCPGANTEFGSEDISDSSLDQAKIVHVGYPPLVRRLYLDDGNEVRRIFERAHAAGAATSLDMTYPDAGSESGRVNWYAWLENVLPHCDLFVPSAPELAFMLGVSVSEDPVPVETMKQLAEQAVNTGAAVVAVKNGPAGLFAMARQGALHPVIPVSWSGKNHPEPGFEVKVAGTTGAGDAAVAGFLFALLKGAGLPEAARIAAAVGACSVETPDALSGIPTWEHLQARLAKPWRRASAAS